MTASLDVCIGAQNQALALGTLQFHCLDVLGIGRWKRITIPTGIHRTYSPSPAIPTPAPRFCVEFASPSKRSSCTSSALPTKLAGSGAPSLLPHRRPLRFFLIGGIAAFPFFLANGVAPFPSSSCGSGKGKARHPLPCLPPPASHARFSPCLHPPASRAATARRRRATASACCWRSEAGNEAATPPHADHPRLPPPPQIWQR